MEFELSAEQKQRIKECWMTLLDTKDGLEAGMVMFSRLFELEPSMQNYFKFQLDCPSLEVKLHVRAVIAALDRCVKHLDDWSDVEEDFEQLGTMHAMLNVRKEQLQILINCFEWMMEKCLNEYFTEERRDACKLFMQIVAEAMGRKM